MDASGEPPVDPSALSWVAGAGPSPLAWTVPGLGASYSRPVVCVAELPLASAGAGAPVSRGAPVGAPGVAGAEVDTSATAPDGGGSPAPVDSRGACVATTFLSGALRDASGGSDEGAPAGTGTSVEGVSGAC